MNEINRLKRKVDNHKIKAVVFDIGNTLIPYDELAVAREVLEYSRLEDAGLELVFESVFRSCMHNDFLMGLAHAEEYFQKTKEELDLDLSEENFFQVYEKVFLSPCQEMVDLMECAKKSNKKIALMSNIDIVLYCFLEEKYPWIKQVDCKALSWDLKALKPNHRFFDRIEKKLSLLPHEIFYIDDAKENVEAARIARGWLAEQVGV